MVGFTLASVKKLLSAGDESAGSSATNQNPDIIVGIVRPPEIFNLENTESIASSGDAESQEGGYYGDYGGNSGDADNQEGGFYGDYGGNVGDAENQEGGFYGDYGGNSGDAENQEGGFYGDYGGNSGDAENQEGGFYGRSQTVNNDYSNKPKTSRPNPLAKYSTYTYGISLHYLTIKQYNEIVALGRPFSTNKNQVLIASGGRRGENFSRHPAFELDLYITDMRMTTVIGLNSKNQGTNAITVDFTIEESMGASFLENLVSVAAGAGIKMWDQMPLVLQIDFFGILPDGTYAATPIPGLTKYICIKIVDIKIAITNRGAEYKMRAIPQSHSALQSKNIQVPVNFEITAKNIQEFFKSTGKSNTQFDLPAYSPNAPKTLNNPTRDENQSEAETRRLGLNAAPKPKSYQSLSLADALNEYQKELAKKGYQEFDDEYVFEIDSEIEKAAIFVPDAHNLTLAPVQNDSVKKETLDKSTGVIAINAGTSLINVINNIIKSSAYYRDKISNATEGTAKDQPITLHKIVPKVEYLDKWDNIRKQYKKRITFVISKFSVHVDQNPNVKKSIPSVMDKQYAYIFMGKNQEILDLKIEFNTLFFQSLTSFETKTSEDNLDISEQYAYAEGIAPGVVKAAKKGGTGSSGGLTAVRYHTASTNLNHNQLSDGSKKSVQAVDLFNSVFNRSGADMVSINMEISGDPDLIKQDDVFYPPGVNLSSSISMDSRELFLGLSFKLPKDIDLRTGLYQFETKNSAFSGIYRLVTVENLFSNGAFKQKLNCVRLFDQPADNQNKQKSRQETVTPVTVFGGDDREPSIDPAFYQDEYGEGGERIGSYKDESSSTDEFNPQTEFELANADIQSWPVTVAVDEYPGGGV